jgi:hypothetical protein
MEGAQPFLETAVVSVDIVNMKVGRFGPWPAGRGQDLARNAPLAGEPDDRLAAIAAQLVVRRDDATQRGGDRGAVELGQYRVRRRAISVAGNENGNLLGRQAALGCFAAPLARRTREIGPPAFE